MLYEGKYGDCQPHTRRDLYLRAGDIWRHKTLSVIRRFLSNSMFALRNPRTLFAAGTAAATVSIALKPIAIRLTP